MSCERWLPSLLQAAENGVDEVNASDRDGLMTHLEECDECRRALEDQRAVRATLLARQDAAVPLGFVARVVSKVDVQTSVSWVDMLRWRTWSYRLAPVALGLLVFGLVTARSTTDSGEVVVGVSELAEVWAFGEPEAAPTFTLWGQDDVGGDLLLDAILSAEPDEPLLGGDPL